MLIAGGYQLAGREVAPIAKTMELQVTVNVAAQGLLRALPRALLRVLVHTGAHRRKTSPSVEVGGMAMVGQ